MHWQVGFHGDLLELRGRSFRKSEIFLHHCVADIRLQTYVYSVVYMASHDPSQYKFSTPTYIALYVTLITAYYV